MAQHSVTGRSMKSHFVPFMHVSRHREIVRQFTPNWFAMTMGAGIVALVLLALPFHFPGQHQVAGALWMFDCFFFHRFLNTVHRAACLLFGNGATSTPSPCPIHVSPCNFDGANPRRQWVAAFDHAFSMNRFQMDMLLCIAKQQRQWGSVQAK